MLNVVGTFYSKKDGRTPPKNPKEARGKIRYVPIVQLCSVLTASRAQILKEMKKMDVQCEEDRAMYMITSVLTAILNVHVVDFDMEDTRNTGSRKMFNASSKTSKSKTISSGCVFVDRFGRVVLFYLPSLLDKAVVASHFYSFLSVF